MKEEIKKTEIKKLNRYGVILTILFMATIAAAVPLRTQIGIYALMPWGVLCVITIFFAYRTEQIKKENHIHTYKEIVAFMGGKRLDELETEQEKGKRPYQLFLFALGSGLIAFITSLIIFLH